MGFVGGFVGFVGGDGGGRKEGCGGTEWGWLVGSWNSGDGGVGTVDAYS